MYQRKMEVEIVAKEVIKPSAPTLKKYNLSFLDQQLYGCIFNKLFFFYKNCSGSVTEENNSERARSLKLSLSKVLTHFYPLAGRTKGKILVFTGEDEGAEFLEARVNRNLSTYLAEPNVEFLTQLVPDDYLEARPLLIVQASFFTCGGLCIGINISHRVADASSFTCFMNAWAGTTIGKFNNFVRPDFSGSLFFPPSDHVHFVGAEEMHNRMFHPNLVRRRFVFSASDIIGLQGKAARKGSIQPPSRVKTISAFLWRIGMKMSTMKGGGFQMPSTLTMPMNLRKILPPPISDHSLGNLFEIFTVYNRSGDTEISNLVSLLTEKIEELKIKYKNKDLQEKRCFAECLGSMVESIELVSSHDATNNFTISSWCGFPLYDADFGWGKPTWVATCTSVSWIVLIDTSDGTGIEAWVKLAKEDMDVFSNDEELLAYATLDPSIQ